MDLSPGQVLFGAAVIALGIVWVARRWRVAPGALALGFFMPATHDPIIQSMQDGMIVLDAQQRVVNLNPAAERIIGTRAAVALQQPVAHVLAGYPDLIAICHGAAEAQLEIAIAQALTLRHYAVHVAPLSGPRRQAGSKLLIFQEITDRKRAEDQQRLLAEASSFLATTPDAQLAPATIAGMLVPRLADCCMVHVLDADRQLRRVALLTADPAKQALADELDRTYLRDPHAPYSPLRVLTSGQPELIIELAEAELSSGAQDVWHLDLLRMLGLRSTICVPLIAREQTLGTLMLGLAESGRHYDLASLRLAENLAQQLASAIANARLLDQLRAADHAKSDVMGHMSHEIRTLMSGVLGMSNLLFETDLNSEQRDFAETIRTSGKALLAVVNSVLDLSKIEAGKLELERLPFDLRVCIEEAIDMVAIEAAEKQLDIAYAFDSQTPTRISGDMSRLRQIVINLLSNAIKFTHLGDVFISITARALGDQRYELAFSVADTGVGISSDQLQDIFLPFHQSGTTPYRRYGGTGLGLSISQQLAELMGGRIWVESQLGVGSTFHFTAIVEEAAPTTQESAQGQSPLLAGKRILIVDQHRRSRQSIALQTESWGMLPQQTSSALMALDWIRQGVHFDCAIIDLRNSELAGMNLVAELRRYRDAQALPLIMLGILGQREAHSGVDARDYQLFLHKPLRQERLHAALVSLCADRPFQSGPLPNRMPAGAPQELSETLRILLAEDDPTNQIVILHILRKLGYHADAVRDGLMVLEVLEREHYDVVLLDIQMPGMDGLEVTRTIRRRWLADRQPYIVAVTAAVIEGMREECISAGMDDYLTKPVQVEDLIMVIEMYRMRAHTATAAPPAERAELAERPLLTIDLIEAEQAPIDSVLLQKTRMMFSEIQPGGFTDILDRYIEDTADLLSVMSHALAQADVAAIQHAAHRLKSSSAIMAATRLADLCNDLEHAIRTNKPTDLHEQIRQIDAEFARVKVALVA